MERLGFSEADGVFEGGGVKGIGLVGALLEFADRGCGRWVDVAGTSAGAIIAAYLACGHDPAEAQELLEHTQYRRFADWGPGGELIGGGWNFVLHRGLAKGDYFHAWMRDRIGGKTFGDIRRTDGTYPLKLIAADVTNRSMLVLPDDLPQYRQNGRPIDIDTFPVADAVRMSMAIPYFFEPVVLLDGGGRRSTVVDGGVLSNFPVWLFDVADRPPSRPTFGFRLVGGRGVGGGIAEVVRHAGWPVALGSDIFHTSTDAWDKRFMSHSTRVRTCPVSAGDVGTTDFDLTAAQAEWLLESGRRGAREFLEHFDVSSYVNTYGGRLA